MISFIIYYQLSYCAPYFQKSIDDLYRIRGKVTWIQTSDPRVSGPMADLSDDSGSEDEDEKRRLKMAKEIARRQSEPAANLNFPAKNRSKKVSGMRIRSPPPPSATGNRDRDRNRKSCSSTEEDGEIIQEGNSLSSRLWQGGHNCWLGG